MLLIIEKECERGRQEFVLSKVKSINSSQSGTETWNDPKDGVRDNLNVTKARQKNVVLCQRRNCFQYQDNSKQMYEARSEDEQRVFYYSQRGDKSL